MGIYTEEDEFFINLLTKFKEKEQISYYEQTFLESLYRVGTVRRNDLCILFRKFLDDNRFLVNQDYVNLHNDMFGFYSTDPDLPVWADEFDNSEI